MDIVEKLRGAHWADKIAHEAADEIESLRWKRGVAIADGKEWEEELLHRFKDIDGYVKEIKQLRKALRHILAHCKSDSPPNAQALILFANKALGKK